MTSISRCKFHGITLCASILKSSPEQVKPCQILISNIPENCDSDLLTMHLEDVLGKENNTDFTLQQQMDGTALFTVKWDPVEKGIAIRRLHIFAIIVACARNW